MFTFGLKQIFISNLYLSDGEKSLHSRFMDLYILVFVGKVLLRSQNVSEELAGIGKCS